MKKLPKYFVIKRDGSNPLWRKYIDWIYKEYKQLWGGIVINYYGYDGSEYYGGNCHNDLSSFKNNQTLITLEEWDECVNGVKQDVELHTTVNKKEPQGYFTYQNWTL